MDAPLMRRGGALAVAALLLVAINWADYATGTEMNFYVFYFVPVATAAWYGGRRAGVAAAALAAAGWRFSDSLNQHAYSRAWLPYWETGIRLLSFLVMALMAAEISHLLRRERRTRAELGVALGEVKELEGLISVCAWCRKVRDDAGYWDRFERFFEHHTKARFSHAICPACLEHMEREGPEAPGG